MVIRNKNNLYFLCFYSINMKNKEMEGGSGKFLVNFFYQKVILDMSIFIFR